MRGIRLLRPLARGHRYFSTDLLDVGRLRNFGISAHIDSGKTTLTERILFYSGRIKEIHEVRGKDGVGAKMDHMELEREKGITITSAATYCSWKAYDGMDYHLNIIDTPGHVDFTVEVERALRVLDGAVMIVCGVGGVQSQTVTVDRQMRRYKVPRIVFVNKLDRYGADPFEVIKQVRFKLGLTVAALQVPIGEEDHFNGIVDVIRQEACYYEGTSGLTVRRAEIPANLVERVEEVRSELIETLANLDDEFGDLYLAGENIAVKDFHDAIQRCTLKCTFSPLLMGSAYKNRGVQNLLDAVCQFLPAPSARQNVAYDAEDEEIEVPLFSDFSKPFVGYGFKIQEHPAAGQLTYMRVYQGKVKKGDQIYDQAKKKRFSLKRLIRMHSNDVKDVLVAGAGDIVAISGVDCSSGTTFTDGRQNVVCSSMYVPDPVMSVAISCPVRDEMQRFNKALNRFQKEDPTFRVAINSETGETVISGMGELHLDIYCERMRREYNVTVKTGEPRVNYRETILKKAPYEYQHKKQSGGRGQFGRVVGYFEPIPEDEQTDDGNNVEFVNKMCGNEIPPNFIPSIQKGFLETAQAGLLSGHPLINTRIVLEDGAAHEVDSSDIAFRLAAAGAFQTFFNDCNPVILEPIMKVEVIFPIEFQASIIGTLSGREGSIEDTAALGTFTKMVQAIVPLRCMFGYTTELRSATQGQGEFTMDFREYYPMPEVKQSELIAKFEKAKLEANS
eukprot:GEMP01013178.1.p1 GENE.GEMP01013178.1~~GEMP01013178.1.p1  ORF type:complete len:737 (+),score=154.60 GEMP01013178.1:22-2211(+)